MWFSKYYKSMSKHRHVLDLTDALAAARSKKCFWVATYDLGVDIAALQQACRELLAKHPIRAKNKGIGEVLRAVSLTHRPAARDPFYDGNNIQTLSDGQRVYSELEFTEFNQELRQTALEDLYRALPFTPGRMRVMLLPPLTVYKMHTDQAPRAHFAIDTNPDCFLLSGTGETHHVRADGLCHVFDTTGLHTAVNASEQPRLHLVIALADYEERAA